MWDSLGNLLKTPVKNYVPFITLTLPNSLALAASADPISSKPEPNRGVGIAVESSRVEVKEPRIGVLHSCTEELDRSQSKEAVRSDALNPNPDPNEEFKTNVSVSVGGSSGSWTDRIDEGFEGEVEEIEDLETDVVVSLFLNLTLQTLNS